MRNKTKMSTLATFIQLSSSSTRIEGILLSKINQRKTNACMWNSNKAELMLTKIGVGVARC